MAVGKNIRLDHDLLADGAFDREIGPRRPAGSTAFDNDAAHGRSARPRFPFAGDLRCEPPSEQATHRAMNRLFLAGQGIRGYCEYDYTQRELRFLIAGRRDVPIYEQCRGRRPGSRRVALSGLGVGC